MKSVREWAKSKGIDPSKVMYDTKTKKIKIDGTTYGAPTIKQGVSYMDEAKLDERFDKQRMDRANLEKEKAIGNYEQTLSNRFTPGTFQYDQSKDVAYQSQVEQGQRAVADALRKNRWEMAKRGILRSSSTSDRADRIVADEQNRLATQVAPALEERAYNRYLQQENMNRQSWQDMLEMAQKRAELKTGVANELNTNYKQKKQELEAYAKYLTDLTGKRVKPTLSKEGMDAQVKGVLTLNEQQTKTTLWNNAVEYARKLSNDYGITVTPSMDYKKMDAQVKGKKTLNQQQMDMAKDEFDRKKEVEDRNYELDKKNVDSQIASRNATSSGSGTGTDTKTELEYPGDTKKDVMSMISNSNLGKKDGLQNVKYENQDLINVIDNSKLSANDKIDLYNSYGMTYKADIIRNDESLKEALINPYAVITRLVSKKQQGSMTQDDFERKLIYYGLWDTYANY